MNHTLNQKISQFLDDELSHEESISLLQEMQMNTELINRKNRYEAISHALKSDAFLTVSTDFSAKIAEQIQHEPHYFLPQKKMITNGQKIFALAASVAVVAVLVGRNINDPAERVKTSSILQLAQLQQSKQVTKTVAETSKSDTYPLNKRINDYLQAHNSSIYVNDDPIAGSMASVTAYKQK
jgi:sigma-E factor negative regulatory protein RseA